MNHLTPLFIKILFYCLIMGLGINTLFAEDLTNDVITKDPFLLSKTKPNIFFAIENITSVGINDNANLQFNKPTDSFYPQNDTLLQIYSLYPINREFAIGPTFFTEATTKIFHLDEDTSNLKSTAFSINAVFLPGCTFQWTPYLKKINKPFLVFLLDIGPTAEINTIIDDGEGLHAKIGGFSNQALILPLMPWHILIMDINILAIMAVNTPNGWFPGVRIKNYFLFKFAWSNFLYKKSNSGIMLKNNYSFILTGKPSVDDLTSQYTYDKMEFSLYTGALRGFEFHLGYSFEYLTFARDPLFHFAHKIYSEIKWKISGFLLSFKYYLSFWDTGISHGFPSHKFSLSLSYRRSRFAI